MRGDDYLERLASEVRFNLLHEFLIAELALPLARSNQPAIDNLLNAG
jgi:hypothetical protein